MKIKNKTKSSAAKRFSRTKTGKLKRKHAYRSHMAIGSTTKQKRHSKKDTMIKKSDKQRYDQLLND